MRSYQNRFFVEAIAKKGNDRHIRFGWNYDFWLELRIRLKLWINFGNLKHYLSFRLKSDESTLPWSTVYNEWQKFLDFIAKNSNKKFTGSVSSFYTKLRNICNGNRSIVLKNCKKLYEKFYQRSIDLQIAERIRLLETTIFSEQKFLEFLRTSGKNG
jgi:hypothetical protein